MSDTVKVFAYGTLQIPEVMHAVTRKHFPAQPARLNGYARYGLVGRSFPGLRAEPGAATAGILYSRVGAEALRRLDDFEDDFYRRMTLSVITDSGEEASAEVYVVPPEYYGLLTRYPWELDEFRRTGLREFMARCRSGE